MNYIKEINSFYDWLETNSIPKSAISLWHALMHINNKAGWVTEFTVAISTLEFKTGFKRSELFEARNVLQQRGRISWRQRSGNQSAIYILQSFSVHNTDAIVDASASTTADAKAYTNPTQTDTINKLNYTKQNETKPLLLEKEAKEVLNKNKVLEERVKELEHQLGKSQEGRKEKSSAKKEKKGISPELAEIIEHLNRVCQRDFKPIESNARHINARLAEGYTTDDLKKVIELKFAQWHNDPKMSEYLRPGTLFNSEKFPSYHNQVKAFENNPQLMNDARKQFAGQNTGGPKQTHASATDLINASNDLFSS